MTDYTHLNVKEDVENASERFGLAPNYRAPAAHRHRSQEEVYVVVSGGGRVKIEDEWRDLRRWDALRFPPQTARGFEAGPDGLELIAIGFGEGGDVEVIENFWVD